MAEEKIILGIDPGTTIMGFGLIKVKGKTMEFLQLNELLLKKYDDHYLKLKLIFERTLELIDHYHPDEIAIEAPFFGKNVQSMLKLGRAQGVAIAAAISQELPVYEYVPRKIKQSICGSGNASKEQVLAMLQSQFSFEKMPETMDASDGLAAALCHVYQFQPRSFGETKATRSKGGGWSQFIKDNPDRIS